jgi:hypothetical protein
LKSTNEAVDELTSATNTAISQEINAQSDAISKELLEIDSTAETLNAQLNKLESESAAQLTRISNDIRDAETSFATEKSSIADATNEERNKLKVAHDSQEKTYQRIIVKSEAMVAKLNDELSAHKTIYKKQKHDIAGAVKIEKDEQNETSTAMLLAAKINAHTSNLVEQITIRNDAINELERLESQTAELNKKSVVENEAIMSIKNELVNRSLITDNTEITEELQTDLLAKLEGEEQNKESIISENKVLLKELNGRKTTLEESLSASENINHEQLDIMLNSVSIDIVSEKQKLISSELSQKSAEIAAKISTANAVEAEAIQDRDDAKEKFKSSCGFTALGLTSSDSIQQVIEDKVAELDKHAELTNSLTTNFAENGEAIIKIGEEFDVLQAQFDFAKTEVTKIDEYKNNELRNELNEHSCRTEVILESININRNEKVIRI